MNAESDPGHASLLVELLVEELPPKALKKLGEAFAGALRDALASLELTTPASALTAFASPRRLAAYITNVRSQAPRRHERQKLMPLSVGIDLATGRPSAALIKRMKLLGVEPPALDRLLSELQATPIQRSEDRIEKTPQPQWLHELDQLPARRLSRALDGKVESLYFESTVDGVALAVGLQQALDTTLGSLPIPKVMSYQLESNCALPGWSSVSFVRPAHGLVALHGEAVVPVSALGLDAGHETHGHRFEARVDPVRLHDADRYAQQLEEEGAVIASFDARRAEIARQLAAAAEKIGDGARPIQDDALLDEVTALVERPNVLVCEFDAAFLEVPPECLILTMKANQKYFPLLDAQQRLTNRFLVVSNIAPEDARAVIEGNERVVRPRLADAKFFFDQDRKKTLSSRVEGLRKVVYHNKLGTQAERSERVRAIARVVAAQLGDDALVERADTAARLAKADLLTDMVGEFPELQGVMGGYYARHDGLGDEVALAIEDHYRPRFAGDELPRNTTGIVVALADKLETLYGMFAIGNKPTGERDPFALRRHALGVIRVLIEKDLPLSLDKLNRYTERAFDDWFRRQTEEQQFEAGFNSVDFRNALYEELSLYLTDRLTSLLREQHDNANEIDAVITLRPQRLGDVPRRLAAVRTFTELPEAQALAAANKRIANILRKAVDIDVSDARIDDALLREPAEQALYTALNDIAPCADALFEAGDYTGSLKTLAALRAPVDAFFDSVMVNADDPALRRNRLALLRTLHEAMNRVADLSRLAA